MGVTGCAKWLKLLSVTLNCFVLFVGVSSIVLGVLTLVYKYGTNKISDLTNSLKYKTLSISVIIGGWLIFVNAFLGCYGALRENRPILIIYVVVIFIVLTFFMVTTILVFVYKHDLKTTLSSELEKTLTNNYGADSTYGVISNMWDDIQSDLHCCGVEGNVTGNRSWFLWQSSVWFQRRKQTDGFIFVPESCCNKSYTLRQCQLLNTVSPGQPVQTNNSLVLEENPAIYSIGCLDKLTTRMERKVRSIAGILGAFFSILCFSMTVSAVLTARIITRKWST